jgi:uncharacterized protein (UPF0332 family)
MRPRDFVDVAGEWAAGTREAEWRSAASRANYAAFHAARDLLQVAGFVVPAAEQAHAYLWLRLANTKQVDVDKAGNQLRDLRSVRNWADYDLGLPYPQGAAMAQVNTAEEVIQLLETIQTTPAILTRITAAIQVYERDVLKQVSWRP